MLKADGGSEDTAAPQNIVVVLKLVRGVEAPRPDELADRTMAHSQWRSCPDKILAELPPHPLEDPNPSS